jgi:hypothetical protein
VITFICLSANALIGIFSFGNHFNSFFGALFGTDTAAFAESKIGCKFFAIFPDALRWTKDKAQTAAIALLIIDLGSLGPPAAGVYGQHLLIGIRPAGFGFTKTLLVFFYESHV